MQTEKLTIKYDLLNPEEFGEWLINARRARGISRRVLAENAGVDITTICKYEIYGHSPSLINFTNILNAMGLMSVIREIDDAEEN